MQTCCGEAVSVSWWKVIKLYSHFGSLVLSTQGNFPGCKVNYCMPSMQKFVKMLAKLYTLTHHNYITGR